MNEVKRQAVSELQKAVTAAERKANEMVSAERTKLDRAIVEARQQASDEALGLLNHQEDSSEVRNHARIGHGGVCFGEEVKTYLTIPRDQNSLYYEYR